MDPEKEKEGKENIRFALTNPTGGQKIDSA